MSPPRSGTSTQSGGSAQTVNGFSRLQSPTVFAGNKSATPKMVGPPVVEMRRTCSEATLSKAGYDLLFFEGLLRVQHCDNTEQGVKTDKPFYCLIQLLAIPSMAVASPFLKREAHSKATCHVFSIETKPLPSSHKPRRLR